MERLLVLRLESVGTAAEAWLNGVPVARTGPGCPVATVAVHEYTLSGGNQVDLVVAPAPAGAGAAAPQPLLCEQPMAASLRLLLPRVGQPAHPAHARTLAELDWAAAEGDEVQLPQRLSSSVDLPISFPRWRWVDAPPVADPQALRAPVAAFLQRLALGLARGDPEPLLLAARLRFEELAQAYQRVLADDVGRFRLRIQRWHAEQPLKPAIPKADTLLLRPLAGGRLLECLAADGSPVLASPLAGGGRAVWPLRVAAIDNRFYVLR